MRPIRARVSRAALAHNLSVARAHAGASRVMAVVKADAYGHGLAALLPAFQTADALAVLALDEARLLRQSGWNNPILLLEGPFDAGDLAEAASLGCWPVLHGAHQLDWLDALPETVRIEAFAKFDTGMHRLGFALDAFDSVLARLRAHPRIAAVTLMTHFAQADEAGGVGWQLAPFLDCVATTGLPWSAANSAALIAHPESRGDWVRPGIMLYGASPFAGRSAASLGLKPVMRLESALIAVRTLAAGEAVGYGCTFRAPRPMRVGVAACGYADGYPRHAPTGTPVAVAGTRTRTLGRVSMDMLCVDLEPVPQAQVGSPVELWGAHIPVDEVAHAAGTIGYELLCARAARVPVFTEP